MGVFDALDPANVGDGSEDLDLDTDEADDEDENDEGTDDKSADADKDKRTRRNRPSLAKRQADRIRGLESKFDQLVTLLQKGGLAANPPKDGANNPAVDVDALRKEIEGSVASKANARIVRTEARSALKDAGFRGDAGRGVRMLDLDGIDPDDEDALADAIEELKEDSPELFGRSRSRRSSTRDRDEDEGDNGRQRESRPSRSREGISRSRDNGTNGDDPLTNALLSVIGPRRERR